MRGLLARELVVAAQYFGILLMALVAAFLYELNILSNGGESFINIGEAWNNVEPYARLVALAFAVLSLIRAALVFAAHHFRRSN